MDIKGNHFDSSFSVSPKILSSWKRIQQLSTFPSSIDTKFHIDSQKKHFKYSILNFHLEM
jgi:hypothetical protein